MPPISFTVSDESINTYGFRVLTSGIQTGTFKKNPIMLYNHNQGWRGTKDEVLPIGIWDNVQISGSKLIADAVFDEGDKFAKKIGGKVERKVLRAASIGFRILETSSSPDHMLPGQTRETVTKCELKEISIVDIPSNRNAVVLYDVEGNIIELGDNGENCPVPLIENLSDTNNSNHKKSNSNDMDHLKIIAGFLGLKPDAELSDVQSKIAELQKTSTEVATLKQQLKDIEDKGKEAQKAETKTLLDKATEAGLIDANERPDWEKNFDANFEGSKRILASMKPVEKLSDRIKKDKLGETTEVLKHKGKTFEEWSKEDPKLLEQLKENQPELFKQLFKSQYGREYRA